MPVFYARREPSLRHSRCYDVCIYADAAGSQRLCRLTYGQHTQPTEGQTTWLWHAVRYELEWLPALKRQSKGIEPC